MGPGTLHGDAAAPGEQSQQIEDSLVPRQSPSGLNKDLTSGWEDLDRVLIPSDKGIG